MKKPHTGNRGQIAQRESRRLKPVGKIYAHRGADHEQRRVDLLPRTALCPENTQKQRVGKRDNGDAYQRVEGIAGIAGKQCGQSGKQPPAQGDFPGGSAELRIAPQPVIMVGQLVAKQQKIAKEANEERNYKIKLRLMEIYITIYSHLTDLLMQLKNLLKMETTFFLFQQTILCLLFNIFHFILGYRPFNR